MIAAGEVSISMVRRGSRCVLRVGAEWKRVAATVVVAYLGRQRIRHVYEMEYAAGGT
jgi:hypothetical protein